MNKPKILIVDDQEINRLVVIKHLEKEYMTISASGGLEALDILSKDQFNLILLDIEMPDITGIDLCKKIKKDNKQQDVPIIFLTASNEPATIKECLESGGNDYIIKPFNPIELKARINSQLKLSEAKEIYIQNEKLKTVNAVICSLHHEINNALAVIAGQLLLIKSTNKVHLGGISMAEQAIKKISTILYEIKEIDFENYIGNHELLLLKIKNKILKGPKQENSSE